jgi:hypothetical protein
MFVDPALLNSGANESHRAGGHASIGADTLARGPLLSGMFGDFAAAEAFHDEVRAAHGRHIRGLHARHQGLTVIGQKAQQAAVQFTDMDESNAATLRAMPCDSDT